MTTLTPATGSWRRLLRLVAWIADLRLAIGLLLLIAVASGIGTAIPQKESLEFYHQRYDDAPWLGWQGSCGSNSTMCIPAAGF
jgi:cytochrome c biogenesis protein